VLIASQILFASSCVGTVPLKKSLPSRSSAEPCIRRVFAVWMAYAYLSRSPITVLLQQGHPSEWFVMCTSRSQPEFRSTARACWVQGCCRQSFTIRASCRHELWGNIFGETSPSQNIV